MTANLGRDHILISHDQTTLCSAGNMGIVSHSLTRLSDLHAVPVDANTAVTLFYHDHDHEPEILRHVLGSEAFYIGAQGSIKAHRTRPNDLKHLAFPSRIEGACAVRSASSPRHVIHRR